MANKEFIVRTIFLANYFDAAATLAEKRRNPTSPQDLINAMKRVDLADKTLERELNALAEKGYDIAAIIQHPRHDQNEQDLLVTTILSKTHGV